MFMLAGLLRENEAISVQRAFEKLGIKINYIDASDVFLSKLKKSERSRKKTQDYWAYFY
jgi:GMP synthase (glutamine-hydrolysing)